MTAVEAVRSCHRRGAGVILAVTLTSVWGYGVAIADPLSDVFQPDAFRTEHALKERTPGLTDPLTQDCLSQVARLTLSAAVDLALCRNPSTRSAWAAARQQAAALGAAQSAWLPSVSATGSETRDFGEHADVTGCRIVLLKGPEEQNSFDAVAGKYYAAAKGYCRDGRITSARHLLDAAAATASSVVQQTVLSVVQTYYGAVAADASLVAAQTTEATDARSLEIARTLREGGAGTLADVLQVETAYDQAVLARIQADAAAKTARGTLAVTMGLPANREFSIEAEPVPAQVPALTARMNVLMNEALQQRPDLTAALAQREAASANIEVARALGRPSISISAGHDLVDTTGVTNENYNLIGVNVTVPIFTGFNVGYGVRQAQAALQSSEANLEQVRLGVTLGVWNAYYAVQSANEQLTVTAGLIKTAEDNNQVALGRYQAGVGSIVDVLTAQAAAAIARVTRINSELAWQVSRAQLALALGRLTGAEPLAEGAGVP